VLTRIFGLKKDETVGEWGKLYSEELHNLRSSQNLITTMKQRMVRRAAHVITRGVEEECMHLREVRRYNMDRINLAQDWEQLRAVVKKVMNLWTP
jgi:hypothetical protein